MHKAAMLYVFSCGTCLPEDCYMNSSGGLKSCYTADEEDAV